MISVCASEKYIEIIEIKEPLFGKVADLDYHRIELSDKQYVSKLKAWVRGKKILLCVPDDPSVPKRIQINGNLGGRLLTEAILDKIGPKLTFPVADLAYDYQIISKDNVLFFGAKKSIITDFSQKLRGVAEEITAVVPYPLGVLEVVKEELVESGVSLYIQALNGKADIYLYKEGVVVDTFSKDFDPTSIEAWIGGVIDESTERAGGDITQIIFSGDATPSGLETSLANRGIALKTASEIVINKAKSLKLNLPKSEVGIFNILGPFGALLYARNKGVIDLTKSMNLSGELHKVAANKISGKSISASKSKFGLKLLKVFLFFIVTILFSVFFYIGYGIFKDNDKERIEEIVIPTFTPSPAKDTPADSSVSASPFPSIVPPAVSRKDIRVQVLNGSGKQGVAGALAKELTALGYENVLVGNAERTDFEKTVIRVLVEGDGLGEVVLTDVKEKYPTTVVEKTLEKNASFDVQVVIGKL